MSDVTFFGEPVGVPSKTVVAIGCSTDDSYAFLLPLTCLMWREVVGHIPLALLVGSGTEWRANPRLKVVAEALEEMKIYPEWLGRSASYADAQLAQNARQHAATVKYITTDRADDGFRCELIIGDDTFFMPADADLWPLRKEPYHHHVGSNYRASIAPYWQGDHFIGKTAFLKAVALGKRSQTIPTCHVAMRACDWRKIYNLTPGEDIATAVKRTLDDWFARFPKDDFNVWMSDQDIMTWKLCLQEWFPDGTPPHHDPGIHASGEVLFVGRRGHPPVDRLCRSVPSLWQMPFDPKAWVDAHMHKNPTSFSVWSTILPIFETVLPQHAKWAKNYWENYIK